MRGATGCCPHREATSNTTRQSPLLSPDRTRRHQMTCNPRSPKAKADLVGQWPCQTISVGTIFYTRQPTQLLEKIPNYASQHNLDQRFRISSEPLPWGRTATQATFSRMTEMTQSVKSGLWITAPYYPAGKAGSHE